MLGTIRGTFRSAWTKYQKRRCTILLFSLFFRFFAAKNRRNILVDDNTKRCYTLGTKQRCVMQKKEVFQWTK